MSRALIQRGCQAEHLVEIAHEVRHESTGDQPIDDLMQQEVSIYITIHMGLECA